MIHEWNYYSEELLSSKSLPQNVGGGQENERNNGSIQGKTI